MKNISFSITTPQFNDGSKDVTRRWGWYDLKPGTRLKKGEKMTRLGMIEVVSAREEPLSELAANRRYTSREMIREGFPGNDPRWFVDMLMKIKPKGLQREHPMRIEFKRVSP